MAQSSDSYHEPLEALSAETRDMHRALVSLQEELEAVDWYRQRADASGGELRDILLHNMREEIEHACMLLEWLRRNNADFQKQMQVYLFTKERITELEELADTVENPGEITEARPLEKFPDHIELASGPRGGQSPRFTVGSLKDT